MPLDSCATRTEAEADGHWFPWDRPRDLVDIRITRTFSDVETEREFARLRRERIVRELFGKAKRSAEHVPPRGGV